MDRVPSRRGRSNNPKQVLLLHDSSALPLGARESLVCIDGLLALMQTQPTLNICNKVFNFEPLSS